MSMLSGLEAELRPQHTTSNNNQTQTIAAIVPVKSPQHEPEHERRLSAEHNLLAQMASAATAASNQ